jgi:homoserine/homoserine lactone efflux protein
MMNEAYLLFAAMAVFTVASPGPGVLMTLDNAISNGWNASFQGILGLALGAAIMASLSSAGVGLLVRSSPTLFLVLKYCGVAYLFYLAYRTWNRGPTAALAAVPAGGPLPEGRAAVARGASRYGLLAQGVLLQTSNPKSLMFFLSVLPQVVGVGNEGGSTLIRLAAAIATYSAALVVVHAVYAGLAARARVWLTRPASFRLMSRLSALVFVAFGFAMLTVEL